MSLINISCPIYNCFMLYKLVLDKKDTNGNILNILYADILLPEFNVTNVLLSSIY